MQLPPRVFVTGTDTDIGKTRVVAALALGFRRSLPADIPVTVVKPVQTGASPTDAGDAVDAVLAARLRLPDELGEHLFHAELRRYRKPADAYSAALAEGLSPPRSRDLSEELALIEGAIVVEGLGGAAVPLNATETIAHLAATARLTSIVVVGLKLGCINHALLTVHYLHALGCEVAGFVLVERWPGVGQDYRDEVACRLSEQLSVLGTVRHDLTSTAIAFAADTLSDAVSALYATIPARRKEPTCPASAN